MTNQTIHESVASFRLINEDGLGLSSEGVNELLGIIDHLTTMRLFEERRNVELCREIKLVAAALIKERNYGTDVTRREMLDHDEMVRVAACRLIDLANEPSLTSGAAAIYRDAFPENKTKSTDAPVKLGTPEMFRMK